MLPLRRALLVLFLSVGALDPRPAQADHFFPSRSPDVAAFVKAIEAGRCSRRCRFGDVEAEALRRVNARYGGAVRYYALRSRTRGCKSVGCQTAVIAVGRRDIRYLEEGYGLDPDRLDWRRLTTRAALARARVLAALRGPDSTAAADPSDLNNLFGGSATRPSGSATGTERRSKASDGTLSGDGKRPGEDTDLASLASTAPKAGGASREGTAPESAGLAGTITADSTGTAAIAAPATAAAAATAKGVLRLVEKRRERGDVRCVVELPVAAARPATAGLRATLTTRAPVRGSARATSSQSFGLTSRLQLDIAAAGAPEQIELVEGDSRRAVKNSTRLALGAGADARLVERLLAAEPVNLTIRMQDGSYASARLEGKVDAELMRHLHGDCGLDVERIPEVSARRGAEEAALRLSAQQLRHIRWTLHQDYAISRTVPTGRGALNGAERDMLRRFTAEKTELPVSSYLTRQTVRTIMRSPFRPNGWNYRTARQRRGHRDWFSYIDTSFNPDRCYAVTEAVSIGTGSTWLVPRIVLWAARGRTDRSVNLLIAEPSTFDTTARPVKAAFDREIQQLAMRRGVLMPAGRFGGRQGGLGNDVRAFIRAIRKYRRLQLSGTGGETGAPLRVTFSALGFTDAFRQMMRDCDRGDLEYWLK